MKAKLFRIPLQKYVEGDKIPEGADIIPVGNENEFAIAVPKPVFSTSGASAMDFYSANLETIVIYPGQTVLIPLGIKVAVPVDRKLSIKPRSGLALKNSLTIVNSPGTIDSDYRGPVGAVIHNLSSECKFEVTPFMRICQGELEISTGETFEEVFFESFLGETERGSGGYNSTGTGRL